MRNLIVFRLFAMFISPALSFGQASDPQPEFTISPARLAHLKAATYLYETRQVTQATEGAAVHDLLTDATRQLVTGRLMPSSGPIFIFEGYTGDSATPFTLKIGFPVADGTHAFGTFKEARLDSALIAIAVYTGPARDVGRAYGDLCAHLNDQGHVPVAGNEYREHWLYFEDSDSRNNVVLLEIPLQS